MTPTRDFYDVLIVGCGPVGATLANLLGQQGHSVAVAEMHPQIYDKPRAINLDQEALRTLQAIGLVDEIIEGCEPHTGTDFLGVDGSLIKALNSAPPPYPLGWPANLMFVQPHAERVLRKGLARFPAVDLLLGYEAVGLTQSADRATVTFRLSEGGETAALSARYVVACDGANSPMRTLLDIAQVDLGFSEWWLVVDAWLKKPTALPPRSTQYCFPDAPSTYVFCSGNLRRWELKILPHEDPQSYLSFDKAKQRMARFVDTGALEFWRSAVYHFHARVAEEWCEGRVLLAGDAAHQMPPFLGQGLCSGMRDAVNLAWKLDMVLKGTANPSLLETYTQERKPHIRALTDITVELGKIIGETDPALALARDGRLRQELESGRGEAVRQNLIPGLERGFVDGSEAGKSTGAGRLAVQPKVDSPSGPVLLDEVIGANFAILSSAPTSPQRMNAELAEAWRQCGGCVATITASKNGGDLGAIEPGSSVLKEQGHLFADWMTGLNAFAVIVRPDKYVYSVARTPSELERQVRNLLARLHNEPAGDA